MALNNLGLGFLLTAKDLASGVVDRVRGKIARLEGRVESMGSSMQEVSGSLIGVGASLVGVGGAIAAGLGFASKAAADFGAGIAEVGTLVDPAIFSTDQMRDSVFKMGQMFGGKMEDQIRAMYQGISAGAMDAASNTALLDQANRLAIAGVTDVRTAVDGLTNVLNAYGQAYTKGNLEGVSDAFFVALRGGKTTAAELAGTLGKLAPVASSTGISIDEMLASVSAVTTKGIATSEAVAGLKAALAGILKPTAEATKEAARLGVKFDAAALRARGLPGFLDDITSSAEFNADSFSKMFGSVEGLNAILALTSNNSSTFNALLDQMGKKAGGTAAAFAKMENTSKHQLALFQSLREQTKVLIGEAIEPLTNMIVKGVNKILKGFNNLSPGMRRMIVGFVGLAAAGMVIAGVVITLVGTFAGLIAAKAALAAGALVLAKVLGAVLLALLPLIIVGGVLFALWKTNAGGFRDVMVAAFDKVKLAFTAITELFQHGGFTEATMKEFGKGNQGVMNFAITVFLWFNRIKNFFKGLGQGFMDTMDKLKPTFDRFVAVIKDIGKQLGFVRDTPDAARAKFEAFGTAGNNVGTILAKALGMVVRGLTIVVTFIDLMIRAWNFVQPVVGPIFDGIVAAIRLVVAVLAGDWGGAWQAAKEVVLNSIKLIVGAIGNLLRVFAGAGDIIMKLFGVDSGMSKGIQEKVKSIQATIDAAMAKPKVEQAKPVVQPSLQALAPGLAAQGVGTPVPQTQEQIAAQIRALQPPPPGPPPPPPVVHSNVRTQLMLNDQVLAEAVARVQSSEGGRGFGPTTAPT